MRRRQAWLTWVTATAAAETVGYAAAALLFNRPYGPIAAGLVEGTCLGLLQGLALRRLLGGFPVAAWWLATAAAATFGWGASSLIGASDGEAARQSPGLLLAAAMGAGLGAGMGLLMGGLQWIVLRRRVARAARWIPVSAAAWAVGMVPAMLAATAPEGPVDTATLLLLGASGGVLMGGAVGAITGFLVAGWAPATVGGQPSRKRLGFSP